MNSYTPSIFIIVSTESTNGATARKNGDFKFDMKATGAEIKIDMLKLCIKINFISFYYQEHA